MSFKSIMAAMIFFMLAGCSAHSPLNLKSITEIKDATGKWYPPHSRQVYVTRSSLPETVEYEVIGRLEVGKVWYGSSDKVFQALADGARGMGADGVVEVTTWFQPSGWSWSAPHGSGKAVKIISPVDFDWSVLDGSWEMSNTLDVIQTLNNANLEMVPGADEREEVDTAEASEIMALRKKLNNAEIAALRKQLMLGDAALFDKSAKEIYRKGVVEEGDLDFLANIIWQNRDKRDRRTVNGLCYLCKVFIKSKNPRYKTFFEQLRKEGKTRKLRKYAIKTLRYLSPGIVAQFEPGQGEQPVSL